ncbi:MAG: hypothetical protein HY278_05765, partial [candidate division NC10 bacterium]|nr:hypothetical protein [candidate division NC10 bacterium]
NGCPLRGTGAPPLGDGGRWLGGLSLDKSHDQGMFGKGCGMKSDRPHGEHYQEVKPD